MDHINTYQKLISMFYINGYKQTSFDSITYALELHGFHINALGGRFEYIAFLCKVCVC